MPTRMRVTIDVTLSDSESGAKLEAEAVERAAGIFEETIRNRLFGAGFLPDDIEVDSWSAKAEPV